MIYNAKEYRNLPTLDQLVDNLRIALSHQPVRHRGPVEPVLPNTDNFIVTRQMSGRYSLKPNISMQPALFRGECNWSENDYSCCPSLFRKEPRYLVENLKYEELQIAMESYPLFQLLRKGIRLSDDMNLRIYNPYGIAMCYGIKTSLLPFTSDLDIASFYACCEKDENGKYKPVINNQGEEKQGILYIFNMMVPFSMTPGLSPVGKQVFPRCGLQKTFALNVQRCQDLRNHSFVVGFAFRHVNQISKRIYNQFKSGLSLEPNDDLLAKKAKEILNSSVISQTAFNRNLRLNPSGNPIINQTEISENNLELSMDRTTSFTVDELNNYYANSTVIWEQFCQNVVFVGRDSVHLRDSLLQIPNKDQYKMYFTK